MTDARLIGHQIATRAATQIVKEGVAAGLDWQNIAIACESAITIVIAAAVDMAGRPDHLEFATELVETMTEHAHKRVTALILGVPYTD
jgi:hypothetical protein